MLPKKPAKFVTRIFHLKKILIAILGTGVNLLLSLCRKLKYLVKVAIHLREVKQCLPVVFAFGNMNLVRKVRDHSH